MENIERKWSFWGNLCGKMRPFNNIHAKSPQMVSKVAYGYRASFVMQWYSQFFKLRELEHFEVLSEPIFKNCLGHNFVNTYPMIPNRGLKVAHRHLLQPPVSIRNQFAIPMESAPFVCSFLVHFGTEKMENDAISWVRILTRREWSQKLRIGIGQDLPGSGSISF